jgi:hypothetical protein
VSHCWQRLFTRVLLLPPVGVVGVWKVWVVRLVVADGTLLGPERTSPVPPVGGVGVFWRVICAVAADCLPVLAVVV